MTEEAVTQETETAVEETLPPEALPPVEEVAEVSKEPEYIPATETLESYFREELGGAVNELVFGVRAFRTVAGDIKFAIFPEGRDGKTRDFLVMGEVARNVTRIAM